MSRKGDSMGFPDYFMRKMKYVADHAFEAFDIAYKAGLKIASGSDLVGDCQPFKGTELELKAKVMGSMNALLAMTKRNAELLKKQDKIGTLEEGKLADLLLVEGDPLKDPQIIQNRDKIHVIMKNGEFFKKSL